MLKQAEHQKQTNFGRIQIEMSENNLSATPIQPSFDGDGKGGDGKDGDS
jgi:hypothetical protein